MKSIDVLRNNIIDKLLSITNREYLNALDQMLEKKSVERDIVMLSEAQILMLDMSEEDIKNNRFISQEELDKSDLEWLKEL